MDFRQKRRKSKSTLAGSAKEAAPKFASKKGTSVKGDSGPNVSRRRKKASEDDLDFVEMGNDSDEALLMSPLQLTEVAKKAKKPDREKVAPAVPPAPALFPPPLVLSAAAEILRLVTIERAAGRCICALVAKANVRSLKAICLAQVPAVAFRHRVGPRFALKVMLKKEIILELCPVCTTLADVIAGMAGAGYLQGVAPKYWHPRIEIASLSPLAAFHYLMQRSGDVPANADIRLVLEEFRAHYAKTLAVNFRFYIVEGKVNKANDVGQDAVLFRIDKFANYMHSITSSLNHYRGNHSDMSCGRLRRGLVCTPFRLFQNCDARVEQIVKANLQIFLKFVLRNEDLIDIEAIFPDQAALNTSFGFIYSNSCKNASLIRLCQFGKLLKDRNAKHTTIFQCNGDIASPFKQKKRK